MCANSQRQKSQHALTCSVKISWPSRRLADEACRSLVKELDRDGRDREVLVTYKCPACAQWHIGHEDVERSRHFRRSRRQKAVSYEEE